MPSLFLISWNLQWEGWMLKAVLRCPVAGKSYPVCHFQLGHFCVLLQLSMVAWLFLAVGASLGGVPCVNKSTLGSSFLLGALVNPLFRGCHYGITSLPHPLNSALEKWEMTTMYVQNSIPATRKWHSFIMLCPISWPDSLPKWRRQGTVLLCPVSYYLHSQEVVVVNYPKVLQEPAPAWTVLLLLSNDTGAQATHSI